MNAFPMTHVQWIGDCCCVTAWTVIHVDGQMIEHRHRSMSGIASVRADKAPIEAGDAELWAMREAIRQARARDNRHTALVLNRYRRGRPLITKAEMDEWRRYYQSAVQRCKASGSGDLVDQAAAGELRPVMGPMEYAQWVRS